MYIGFIEGSKVLTDQIRMSFFVEGHLVYIGFIEGSNVLTDQIDLNFFRGSPSVHWFYRRQQCIDRSNRFKLF